MQKHQNDARSIRYDAQSIKHDAQASSTMHKHQDDAQAPKMFPGECTAQVRDQWLAVTPIRLN